MTDVLETDDIQGLVVRGYGTLHAARFLLLEVTDPVAARRYIARAISRVNRASESPAAVALQLAFTAQGLNQLGLSDQILGTFSREFIEGMADRVRAESLGDVGANAPDAWRWGRANIHAMVMVYATSATIDEHVGHELAELADGFRVVHEQRTTHLRDHKEHFGWRDGLSMPTIDGVPSRGHHEHPAKPSWTTPINPGEFVLGYRNEYDVRSESPSVAVASDPTNQLPFTDDRTHKDLGRNGTYLVYRQYTQHVQALWRTLATNTTDDEAAIALGAKMVGRWPNGAPVVDAEYDDPAKATNNEFDYYGTPRANDRIGLRCPIGAHIRRANPRDQLAPDRTGSDSIAMVRKHQMIRRGRPYGPPVSATMDPYELLTAGADREDRGLHFICLVGQINRQFELVQRSWLHSANFNGLFKDGDPISAVRVRDTNANDEFTVPCEPVRHKYQAMPAFTQLVGGAYFFLPSIAALRFIAREPASPSSAPGSGSSASPSTRPPQR